MSMIAAKPKIGLSSMALAKRALFLAWTACRGTFGNGFLQDRPEAAEQDVWNNAVNAGDYPGRPPQTIRDDTMTVYADYVFDRMMKLRLSLTPEAVVCSGDAFDPAFNAFARTYPTASALLKAAEDSLLKELEVRQN